MKDDIQSPAKTVPCREHQVGGEPVSLSLKKRTILSIKRVLGFKGIRILRRKLNTLLDIFSSPACERKPLAGRSNLGLQLGLSPGERVRVLSEQQINATLDHVHQLKGCSFIPEMARFCGTSQIVLKRVERLVDERDLRVLKPQGIVLLVGVTCEGGEFWGQCDRDCYYFWREEWLERLPADAPLAN